jgi:hypothetical protein
VLILARATLGIAFSRARLRGASFLRLPPPSRLFRSPKLQTGAVALKEGGIAMPEISRRLIWVSGRSTDCWRSKRSGRTLMSLEDRAKTLGGEQ